MPLQCHAVATISSRLVNTNCSYRIRHAWLPVGCRAIIILNTMFPFHFHNFNLPLVISTHPNTSRTSVRSFVVTWDFQWIIPCFCYDSMHINQNCCAISRRSFNWQPRAHAVWQSNNVSKLVKNKLYFDLYSFSQANIIMVILHPLD